MDDVGLFEPGDLGNLIVADGANLLVLLVQHLNINLKACACEEHYCTAPLSVSAGRSQ